jgi:phosphonate transport system permease protein
MERSAAALPPRPSPLRPRGAVLLAILAMGVWAFVTLDLTWSQIVPGPDDFRQMGHFLSFAFRPAFSRPAEDVVAGAPPLLLQALRSAQLTLVFAVTAMSVSVAVGIVLGFLASNAWWAGDPAGARTALGRWARRVVAPAIWSTTRVVIAGMRSVHELIWAVLFLAAMGLNDLSAVIAIAIPFGGTLAKVFSEMLDEAPRNASVALRAAGARPGQVFVFGLLPRALPDMSAYALYRLECALRSSAILGFFGWETLGYFVKLEWESADYAEVWTYLYTLLALVLLVEWWSSGLRRRFVS